MSKIEIFDNPYPDRLYEIQHVNNEFTSVCPVTGLPDFGKITITYSPDKKCLELKSLKYYFLEFRNQGIYYEAVTNKILEDLVAACDPIDMFVISEWGTRGGMTSTITATYVRPFDEDEEIGFGEIN